MRHIAGESQEELRRTTSPEPVPDPAVDPSGALTVQDVSTLQRVAGNRAVASLMRSMVARDAHDGEGDAAATADQAPAPAATVQEEPELDPATDRGAVPDQAAARPKFDLAGGQTILTKAFGGIKAIVPGKIQLLDQAEFQAAYDKIYGAGDYSWDKYVKPKYGSLNGFAYQGTNYINKASAGLHTIVHEMLHNNCAADFIDVVGSRFNEGATEVLTKKACALFDEPAPTTYPGESPVVQEALDNGLPMVDLEQAYLSGGAKTKIADWVDAHCVLSWAKFKAQFEAGNWAAAKAGLAVKSLSSDKAPDGAGAGDLAPVGAGAGSQSG